MSQARAIGLFSDYYWRISHDSFEFRLHVAPRLRARGCQPRCAHRDRPDAVQRQHPGRAPCRSPTDSVTPSVTILVPTVTIELVDETTPASVQE